LKTRIVSGAIGLLLLTAVVLMPQDVLGAAVFVIALMGLYEFFDAVSHAGYKPIRFLGYISCIPLLLLGVSGSGSTLNKLDWLLNPGVIACAMFILVVIMLATTVFLHDKYNLLDVSVTAFGILYITFLFSFLILTRKLDGGEYFIWIIFIGAWVTDTAAYFSGMAMGKTKIIPQISPKKTVEGSIGGVVGCILATIIYGMIISGYIRHIPAHHFIIIGLINGVLSQIGDWAASAIKRYTGIKDYGSIMPGHGGVLDRFDSILFIAPVVYFYIDFIII
jgi:phosphatidate cytidylyltransferase